MRTMIVCLICVSSLVAAQKTAPGWTGNFPYLGMHTGMTKQEAVAALDSYRNIKLRCSTPDPRLEFCNGKERELVLSLSFKDGRLLLIEAEDKYSPFGAFSSPFVQKFGEPPIRKENELQWEVRAKSGIVETCRVYLSRGNANVAISRLDR